MSKRQQIGLYLGPLLFTLLLLAPLPAGLSSDGLKVAAVAVLMATWWITEAIPIPATALLPIVLFPLLGVMPTSKVTPAYANHLIYLFLGGFLIAIAIEKWQLHKRIALHTIHLIGVTPKRIIFGFMLATAFLSAWISNTATAMLMTTIGLALLKEIQQRIEQQSGTPEALVEHKTFGTTLMLGIAYAASIGGVATIIGTPPNAIMVGVLEKNHDITISFAQWLQFGVPISLVMLLIAWVYLSQFVLSTHAPEMPGGKRAIKEQLAQLGAMSTAEKRVLVVFLFVAFAWIFKGIINLPLLSMVSDSSIAILGALLLFVIPSGIRDSSDKNQRLLDWASTTKLPWDIIILFGGGFALAGGFSSSGLTSWLAEQLGMFQGVELILLLLIIVLLVIFLTEITSNTATASLLLPVMGAFALGIDIHPLFTSVAVAIAASYAFMLPVATPPNAIVFGSRQVTIVQMATAGIWLNLIGSVVITLFVYWLLPIVFLPTH